MTQTARPVYRERLAPSLWVLCAAAVAGPMITLTFTPLGTALALVIGLAVTALIVSGLVLLSPRVRVEDGVLHAGRARIEGEWLGAPVALTAEEARTARGPALPATGWHLIRGGIDGVVVVPVQDSDDPAPSWTISTRTPDRLAAAIESIRSGAAR